MKQLLEQILKNQEKILEILSPKVEKKSSKDDLFETAWVLYERKGSKKKSKERWSKLDVVDKYQILEAIPKYIENNPNAKYRKDFERFISYEIYKDIIEILKEENKGAANKEDRKVFELKRSGGMFSE